jgi:hypothetical protein
MSNEAYEVIKATEIHTNIEINGKKMPFGKLDAFRVKDPGVAKAIEQKYGSEVVVDKIDTTPLDEKKTHPNRIVMPALPWHEYDETGKIIRKEKKDDLHNSGVEKQGREKDNGKR